MRFLSGVQPSGTLHLGNYFGAIKQHLELQQEGECYYFIADYHALTTIRDAAALEKLTREVAATYLALGLDPERACLYRQSDVPQVCELTWLLSSVTGMGLLERATSYKDKIARNLPASVGLFTYPVLMAADILAVQADVVPVGGDQVQHVEMARDMAGTFNSTYQREVFKLPAHRLNKDTRVPGTRFERDKDGEIVRDEQGRKQFSKMSKSYGNTICIFDEGKVLKRKVMSIETDSSSVEDVKNPEDDLVVSLYRLVAGPEDVAALENGYRQGGMGYAVAKKDLLAKLDAYFGPYRERYRELLADPGELTAILHQGAARAGKLIDKTLDAARRACGLGHSWQP
jgi:tryptophanyl-tRNA synthetase